MLVGACSLGYLGRRQENHLHLGGGGCSELSSHHCTPAWMTERLGFKKNKKKDRAWEVLGLGSSRVCMAAWEKGWDSPCRACRGRVAREEVYL